MVLLLAPEIGGIISACGCNAAVAGDGSFVHFTKCWEGLLQERHATYSCPILPCVVFFLFFFFLFERV